MVIHNVKEMKAGIICVYYKDCGLYFEGNEEFL